MNELLTWIEAHWDDVAKIIAMIIGIASIIVRLTPSVRDDNFLLPVIRFVGKYIALNRDPAIDKEYRTKNPVE